MGNNMMKNKMVNDNLFGLSFLYKTKIGRMILKPLVKNRLISFLSGCFLSLRISKILIKPFVKRHNINMDDYEDKNYTSFNDFFIRKIKKDKRIPSHDKNHLISPCDGMLSVYQISDKLIFKVKNSFYNVHSLLRNDNYAKKFNNGVALIFRLTPSNYHRYVFIDDGVILDDYKIKGIFHSVNPIAYENFKVFTENERNCTYLETKNFGYVMQVEIGALLVGKIKNVKKTGSFKKGEEKGYFMYGGSTVILLFEKDAVIIDKKYQKNTELGFELSVKQGKKIGKKRN